MDVYVSLHVVDIMNDIILAHRIGTDVEVVM